MKLVIAGYGVGYSGVGGYSSGTCCWHSSTSCDCHVSKTEALFMAGCDLNGSNCNGGGWCCDSCGTATWTAECGY